MYKKLLIIISSLLLFVLGWWGSDTYKNYLNKDFSLGTWNKPKPLLKYTIENLSKTEINSVEIKRDDNLFYFEFDPTLEYKSVNKIKKVTGLLNVPNKNNAPLLILLRGYVDQSIYQTGMGTKRVGEFFRDNGYITLAPDFLGYGGSDIEAENIFESRFQTYTTTLTLLKSINKDNFPEWDGKNVFIWAHSNGGQIALTILEITGKNYPTVLWAPVTENFPYSVLFYTNESSDRGKLIRSELAKFEEDYNVDEYSLTNYFERINAPIEYHWGTKDDAIPVEWRDKFIKSISSLHKNFTDYKHSNADHNMNPLWSDVIKISLKFFNSNLQKTID